MRKAAVIVAVILFFFYHIFPVSAQSVPKRFVCLKAERCDLYAECNNIPEVTAKFHKAWLTTDPLIKPLPNTDTYIIECIATDKGQICTTGTAATDAVVYGQDNVALLAQSVNYQYEGLFSQDGVTPRTNPIKSANTGEIGPLIWGDSTPVAYSRKWLALNYGQTPNDAFRGSQGAVQQGTIDFDFATAEKDCLSIAWDPYGRVFDSQSLEPVPGTTVTLMIKRADGNFTPVTVNDIVGGDIVNPQTTLEDGMFSFVVPDGTYKLTVAGNGLTFPVTDINQLHTNYRLIYSDIYPAITGDEIQQAGSIQHRDIPAVAATPNNGRPTLMSYFYEVKQINKKGVVQGTVSHPFTKIIAYSVKPSATNSSTTVRYRQIAETQANKLGRFKLEFDQSTFETNEIFGELDLAKVDLTLLAEKDNDLINKFLSYLNKIIYKVNAESGSATTIKFDPILVYIEGYAYNQSGQVIPNADVEVYLKFSSKPYYQTNADATGYFKISSDNLPTMPYELRYKISGGTISNISTAKFVNQNQKFLKEKNIDLFSFKNQQGKTIDSSSISPTLTKKGNNDLGNNNQQKINQSGNQAIGKTQSNNIVLLIGILFFLLVIVIIVLGIYLLKKKQVATF